MNISAISIPYNNIVNKNQVSVYNKQPISGESCKQTRLMFGSSYAEKEIVAKQTLARQRNERIKEIDESQYKEIMDYLIEHNSDMESRTYSNKHYIDLSYCKNVPFEFLGVIPYCGYESCNVHINNFIDGTEKQSTEENEENNARFISALNYSLDRIDEKYGKFEGYTYRRGAFSPTIKRYYSTGESVPNESYIYSRFGLDTPVVDYHIIKLKNGHKLNEMLDEYALSGLKDLAAEEDEILISPSSNFRFIPESEYNDEIQKVREEYFNSIVRQKRVKYSDDELNKKVRISVWEEI